MRVVEALSDGAPSSVTESTRLIVQSINQHNEALFRINQQAGASPLSSSSSCPRLDQSFPRLSCSTDSQHSNKNALQIHENPELGYEEVKAHDNICSMLESLGYTVQRHTYGLQTSFMAEYGSGGRVVAFNAEYDALPEIGHACGHNLIAMMSIGAFLGVAEAIKAFKVPGRVRLIGTPAEEGLGGKLKLIDAGAFKDVDACLMTHPGPEDTVPGFSGDAYMPTLANHKFTVRYTGKPAHASMSPWHGLNALDAVVLAYNGVSALRQQMRPDERIHGVITQGGTRPNIITAHASLDYYIRSPTLKSADELMQRAKRCFDGAALQTGCSVEYEMYGNASSKTLVADSTLTGFQNQYLRRRSSKQDDRDFICRVCGRGRVQSEMRLERWSGAWFDRSR